MNGQSMENKAQTIMARAIIPIFYSSMTNTAKKYSFALQNKLQDEGFLVTVTNIGDVDKEEFLELTGPAIFLLATYGNGGSPADGEQFMEWFNSLEKNNLFEKIQFAVVGFGNRSFQHFCGNANTFRNSIKANGARQMLQLVQCNSASTDETVVQKFPEWSAKLIEILKQKHQIKEMNVSELLQKFKIIASEEHIEDDEWEKDLKQWQSKLGKQFMAYYKSYKAEVIHIKQLRTQNDGRSTVWVRIKKPQGLDIQPGCNISVYPQNVRKQGQKPLTGSVKIQTFKKTSKVAYPPMSLERLWKISNFNQIADTNLVKYAVTMSQASEQMKSKYISLLKDHEEYEKNPVRCWKLYQDLNPGIDFIVKLGINTVRPYTLSSWCPNKSYIDLTVAVDPMGLTSKYLKSNPTHLKIKPSVSSFYVPSGRPLVMVANGTGIAPFRSLVQYFIANPTQMTQLHLYFGIQNKQTDFYFRQEWEQLEKQGKIKLRIAESRANPDKKVYVQQLLKEDVDFITKHLFENKGVLFVCGSSSMAKGVDTQVFEAVKKVQKIPFKAFKLNTELIKNKTIVKQIFE